MVPRAAVSFRSHLFETDAEAAGEGLVVAADIDDIAVLGDGPVAASVFFVDPGHRIFFAESGEGGVGDTLGVGVM